MQQLQIKPVETLTTFVREEVDELRHRFHHIGELLSLWLDEARREGSIGGG